MSTRKYTYELVAKDSLSGTLTKIKGISQGTYDKLANGQTRFNEKVKRGSQRVSNLKSKLTSTIGAYVSLGIGIMVARDSLKKWDTQMQAEAQVMQGIKTTNMAAGRSFEQLTKAASDLQKKTIFGDEAILQGVTAQMLTFTHVTGNAFDRAQQAALDVTNRLYGAKASTESLRGTSIMLGKALNDPVANMGALSRAGIHFDDETTNLIKSLWSSGQEAEAQAILLSELEKQYGGSAEAAAKAGMGAWQQFMNRMGDVQEAFGPLLNKLLTGFINLFDWIDRNSRMIGLFATAILGAATAYGIFFLVVNRITIITKIWTAVQWALNVAMNANPLGLIITLIGALIMAVIYAWYKFEGFRGVIFGLWESFKAVFTGIKDLVKSVMGGVGELILGALTFDIDRIKSGLSKLGEGFSNYGKGIVDAYKKGAEAGEAFQPKVPAFLKGVMGEDGAAGAAGAGAGTNPDLVNSETTEVVNDGVTNITQGGKKQTNVSVIIEKMIETFNVKPGEGQSWEDIEDKVIETLMRVINSANKMQTA